MNYPDGNPKTAVGAAKVSLHLVPPSATHYLAEAFADGARKYGPYNWREKGVSASVYVAAAMRHMDAYRDGEDLSRDAQVHHLAHVMACCAIILDAASVGKLNDDRPPKGAAADLQAEFAASHPIGNELGVQLGWMISPALGGYVDPVVVGPSAYDAHPLNLPSNEDGS